MSRRLEWLDMAKGLGMILVILGHTGIYGPVAAFIYTFHMPLFFFLSGYLFSVKKYPNTLTFIRKKIKSLIKPYLIFGILAYIWLMIQVQFLGINNESDPFQSLLSLFTAIRNTPSSYFTGTLWFLVCLFCTEVLFYFLYQKIRNKKILFIVVISFSLFGYIYGVFIGIPLPLSLDVAFMSLLFYFAGFCYKIKQQHLLKYINVKFFILLGVINICFGFLNVVLSGNRVDMYFSHYGNYFLFLLSAFAGIGAFLMFVQYIKSSEILNYIGQNSLLYLTLHQVFLISFFRILTDNRFDLLSGAIGSLKSILLTIIILITCIPLILIYNKIDKKFDNLFNRSIKLT